MIEAMDQIVSAAVKPLTKTESWYGIWFAIALRKIIMKRTRDIISRVDKEVFQQEKPEKSNDSSNTRS